MYDDGDEGTQHRGRPRKIWWDCVKWDMKNFGLSREDAESVPESFIDYFNKNDSVHTHNTRTKNDVRLPRINTGHGLKCLKYKIPKLWNKLPTDLKEQTSLNTFKNELKLYLTTKLYNDN